MRLKKEPSAVNMRVELNDVTMPMPDSMPNHARCSRNDDAPARDTHTHARSGSAVSAKRVKESAATTQQHSGMTLQRAVAHQVGMRLPGWSAAPP